MLAWPSFPNRLTLQAPNNAAIVPTRAVMVGWPPFSTTPPLEGSITSLQCPRELQYSHGRRYPLPLPYFQLIRGCHLGAHMGIKARAGAVPRPLPARNKSVTAPAQASQLARTLLYNAAPAACPPQAGEVFLARAVDLGRAADACRCSGARVRRIFFPAAIQSKLNQRLPIEPQFVGKLADTHHGTPFSYLLTLITSPVGRSGMDCEHTFTNAC